MPMEKGTIVYARKATVEVAGATVDKDAADWIQGTIVKTGDQAATYSVSFAEASGFAVQLKSGAIRRKNPLGGAATKRRRRRADKETRADLYAALHALLPDLKTEEALSKQFSDKELRILMKHNGMLINNYDQRTCSYTELTKAEKCRRIVTAVPTMIVPGREAGSLPRPPLHDPPARLNASAKAKQK